jgi:acetyl/propionyl-CoA carboxylase alpha subunit
MKKLVIANRGEISRRILKAARERAYIVAVISTQEDSDSLVCQESDFVLLVSSFLNANEIVEKSLEWGANFIHPGYGFLSENSEFAELVEKAGIVFVGPTPENMKAMGSKEAAKKVANHCSVPTLNALLSHDLKELSNSEWENELKKRKIFSPFLVKASGGGGGRGMRVVKNVHELPSTIKRASEEAKASFNDGTVFVERYLESPRHIEIQVFGDGKGGGVFFGERECSLQRRHQKVIEEAPSAQITVLQREKMGKASLALVKETKYRGAGTLEFLMDDVGHFYFLEMNTRLQVEHPVTENAYGIDLVHAQFDLAEGRWPSSFPDSNEFHLLEPKAVSLEVRILAEDPRNDFLPTPGKILVYREPEGEGVRVDTGVTEGARVNPSFDSMIAKLIVTAPNRALAIKKLSLALEDFVILGCTTNIPFLQSIVRHQDFLLGNESTNWIAKNILELNTPIIPNCLLNLFQSNKFREKLSLTLQGEKTISKINYIFFKQGQYLSKVTLPSDNQIEEDFEIIRSSKNNKFYVFGESILKSLQNTYPQNYLFSEKLKLYSYSSSFKKNIRIPFYASRISQQEIQVCLFGEYLKLECPFYAVRTGNKNYSDSGEVRAPMAGKVFEVLVAEGQDVLLGQVLFIVESMKMQLEVKSAGNGKVTKIFVEQGQILSGLDIMAMVVLEA